MPTVNYLQRETQTRPVFKTYRMVSEPILLLNVPLISIFNRNTWRYQSLYMNSHISQPCNLFF